MMSDKQGLLICFLLSAILIQVIETETKREHSTRKPGADGDALVGIKKLDGRSTTKDPKVKSTTVRPTSSRASSTTRKFTIVPKGLEVSDNSKTDEEKDSFAVTKKEDEEDSELDSVDRNYFLKYRNQTILFKKTIRQARILLRHFRRYGLLNRNRYVEFDNLAKNILSKLTIWPWTRTHSDI